MTIKSNIKSIVWLIIITILSLVKLNPDETIKELLIPHTDKLVHLFLYTVLSFLLLIENKKSKRIFVLMLFAISYGILMELAQHFLTIYRSFDIFDILSNSTGVIIGYFIYKYYIIKRFNF